jgi:C-terminal processing protease CtpA/Prc
MWPMLAGLGALLGEGRIGEFHSSRGVTGVWFHEAGVTGIEPTDRSPRVEIDRVSEAHQLDRHPPVAVLIDGGAGSSGEATALAFIGHPQTRSFGLPTYGFTTANDRFRFLTAPTSSSPSASTPTASETHTRRRFCRTSRSTCEPMA